MMTDLDFTPRDVLAGHLAALVPCQPQTVLESAADGLSTLGYRRLDPAAVNATLNSHVFTGDEDGDGWNEPRSAAYHCSCTRREYVEWMQSDREHSGLEEFKTEGYDKAIALHHAHLAEILTGTALVEPPAPTYVPVLTEDAIVAGANQMRSQTRDFTSSDLLMRKRARFVLIAAIRYLGVEKVR
jgi:hypothetical protein